MINTAMQDALREAFNENHVNVHKEYVKAAREHQGALDTERRQEIDNMRSGRVYISLHVRDKFK